MFCYFMAAMGGLSCLGILSGGAKDALPQWLSVVLPSEGLGYGTATRLMRPRSGVRDRELTCASESEARQKEWNQSSRTFGWMMKPGSWTLLDLGDKPLFYRLLRESRIGLYEVAYDIVRPEISFSSRRAA
ncbi:uncharacterized protein BDZ83DRAFT_768937 [Colletotrichum acutatum]|uniref:Uncharacterized protein n=1 Tax=Glomerella acutata TaxID=27357 RepID=A0AAD8UAA9_GLOAC|nr:uncharacterized protein BDZ83DRAFT_768937 [Colletotrichum acutatum]KAK1707938.1 hypothetical protein BDZ83DRAFT_768937 [Colletotrichum acutatum]